MSTSATLLFTCLRACLLPMSAEAGLVSINGGKNPKVLLRHHILLFPERVHTWPDSAALAKSAGWDSRCTALPRVTFACWEDAPDLQQAGGTLPACNFREDGGYEAQQGGHQPTVNTCLRDPRTGSFFCFSFSFFIYENWLTITLNIYYILLLNVHVAAPLLVLVPAQRSAPALICACHLR